MVGMGFVMNVMRGILSGDLLLIMVIGLIGGRDESKDIKGIEGEYQEMGED